MCRVILCLTIGLLLAGCAVGTVTPTAALPTSTPSPTISPSVTPPTPSPVTPTSAPTVTPLATVAASPGLAILYFLADQEALSPGETVVLEWQTTGASNVSLSHDSETWTVEPSGTFAYTTQPGQFGCHTFTLDVANDAGEHAYAQVAFRLPCPESLFFSSSPYLADCGLIMNYGCPYAAVASDAAEQHFEHGTMVWVRSQDLTYVLFDDVPSPLGSGSERACQVLSDNWDESQPADDPSLTPPAGLYQPVRGFGLVWRQNSQVRDRLGWAVDREAAFGTLVQRVPGYGRHSSDYLRALDGNVWGVYSIGSGCAWERIPVGN